MVRDILGFLVTLSTVAFLVGLALGIYLGIKVGMSLDDSRHVAAAVLGWSAGGGGIV